MNNCIAGFKGERNDPSSGCDNAGNGYRAYNIVLMRFHCPDDWSPFEAGGLNAYVYCAGDPVNKSDPSGHLSWQAGVGIALGVIGLLGGIVSGGASIAAAGCISDALASTSCFALISGGTSAVSDVTSISSAGVVHMNPEAASALAWFSFATGILVLGAALASQTVRGIRSLTNHQESIVASISLGGPVTEHTFIGENYVFKDTYKGSVRLNIAAHGAINPEGHTVMVNSMSNDSAELFYQKLLLSHVKLDDVQHVRLLMCYSANNKQASFASRLSQLSAWEIKGYQKKIYVRFKDQYDGDIFNHSRKLMESGQKIPSLVIFKPRDYGWCTYHFIRIFQGIDSYSPMKFRKGDIITAPWWRRLF